MSAAGTLLTDLDSKGPSQNDGDLVQQILADMNTPGSANQMMPTQQALPPAPSARAMAVMNDPNPNTMMQYSMDEHPSTSHIIGGQHPNPADFASLLPNQGQYGPPGMMGAPYYSGVTAPVPPSPPPAEDGWLKSSKKSILRELKTPLLVAIIVFLVSLPFVNTMIGLYFPRLLRVGGDATTIGMLVKSLSAGVFFWVLQRVLVPLVAP
jgi:hypothetical protein